MIKRELIYTPYKKTWLNGITHYEINRYHVHRHRLDLKKCSRGQESVSIIVSPTTHKAYMESGTPSPIIPTKKEGIKYGHFIGLCFNIKVKQHGKGYLNKEEG